MVSRLLILLFHFLLAFVCVHADYSCNDTAIDCAWRNNECERFTCQDNVCTKQFTNEANCCLSPADCEIINCYNVLCVDSTCTRGGYNPDLCERTWRDYLTTLITISYLSLIFLAVAAAASYGIYVLVTTRTPSRAPNGPGEEIYRPEFPDVDRNIAEMRDFTRRMRES